MHGFQEAELEDIRAQTFVGNVQSPLATGERIALTSLFEMLWGQPQSEVSPDDWQSYQRLCNPESTDFILDIQDYYALHLFMFSQMPL
jgi:demethylmenaquinone methyltransferase/2-methoxy-6-polyprenyl-1,4-benzoquinol methylase